MAVPYCKTARLAEAVEVILVREVSRQAACQSQDSLPPEFKLDVAATCQLSDPAVARPRGMPNIVYRCLPSWSCAICTCCDVVDDVI